MFRSTSVPGTKLVQQEKANKLGPCVSPASIWKQLEIRAHPDQGRSGILADLLTGSQGHGFIMRLVHPAIIYTMT